MNYTITELLWLLLVYSLVGWIIETVVGSLKHKKFVNRGFLTGPFCLVYGITAVLMTVTTEDLLGNTFFLFLGCGILATAVEWFTGRLLEHLNSHKWWDYSSKKWNYDGYICLQCTLRTCLWKSLDQRTLPPSFCIHRKNPEKAGIPSHLDIRCIYGSQHAGFRCCPNPL